MGGKSRNRLGQNGHATRVCACAPCATHALCDARHSRARVRVRCYAIHAALCALPTTLTRTRAHPPPVPVCASPFFCGNARNVVEVGSPKSYASELPQDQGRAADQRGQTPASAHRTLIQPILPRRPSGTVNLGQAIRRRPPAIRRRPQRAIRRRPLRAIRR